MVNRITNSAYAVLRRDESVLLPASRKIRGGSAEDLRRTSAEVISWGAHVACQQPANKAAAHQAFQPASLPVDQPAVSKLPAGKAAAAHQGSQQLIYLAS